MACAIMITFKPMTSQLERVQHRVNEVIISIENLSLQLLIQDIPNQCMSHIQCYD